MSDGFSASWADADDLHGLPAWAQYELAIHTVHAAEDKEDADKTLFAQLTYPELAVIPFALLVMSRIFPELRPLASRLSEKLHDLAREQEFLARGSTEDSLE